MGEEGAGSGIPKVAGSGRKRGKLHNIAQYFAIEKMQRGGSQKLRGGNQDLKRVREAGGLNPPVPPLGFVIMLMYYSSFCIEIVFLSPDELTVVKQSYPFILNFNQ